MIATKNQPLENKSRIVRAVRTYIETNLNLRTLSIVFGVSENTLANWFCEAVSKKYVSDDMCLAIKRKHIEEYEYDHNINNSSLKDMYDFAFNQRKIISPDPIVIVATPATT